jgi:D-amino-acid dehydrogenase
VVSDRAVVIGGGAIGIACAHFLTSAGFAVTVVDRGEVGRGCSFANAGLIVPGDPYPLPGPGVVREGLRHLARRDGPFAIRPRLDPSLARWLWTFRRSSDGVTYERGKAALASLSRASLQLYEDLAAAGEIDFGFRRVSLIRVFLSPGWRAPTRTGVRDLQAMGFRASVLEPDELRELEPALAPAVGGGVVVEGQASGDCFAYVRSLAARLRSRGVRILERRRVHHVVVRDGRACGVSVAETSAGRGWAREEIPADLVVLAAGAWTPALSSALGLRVPIQPATGYSATVPTWSGAPRQPLMVEERHVAITPLGDRVRIGGTLELSGFRTSPDPVRAGAVLRGAGEALAEPPPAQPVDTWFGFRPLTPDDLPLIGWAPGVRALIVAAGHGTLGFTQSPITGKLVAELACGEPTSVPLEPFRPEP